MCTIGVVFTEDVYVYKQCDLTAPRKFNVPEVRDQKVAYIAMTREGRPGLWAGTNRAGVSFVAADAYTNGTYETPDDAVNALFVAYENSVGNAVTAREAANMLEQFYRSGYNGNLFPGPDIALFADKNEAVFIEFTPGPNNHDPIREVVVRSGFFASTNHFRIQPDAVLYDSNHSTYLRLERSEVILEKYPSREGVMSLLRDRYYGPSELSICRVAQYPGEYYTQATALFGCRSLSCYYQVNSNPLDTALQEFVSDKWPSEQAVATPLTSPLAQLDLRYGLAPVPPPARFLYVPQANYALVPMFRSDGPQYLYSDSATSCIIVIATGTDAAGQWIASLAHLDSPDCINAYFAELLDKTYCGRVDFYAQGANPPGDGCSEKNAAALRHCLDDRSGPKYRWVPEIRHLGLGEGDPRYEDRGDFGISLESQVPIVSTQPFSLELLDRDPTGGEQTLFCIMRRNLSPPIQLHNVQTSFEESLIGRLIDIAATYQKDSLDPKTAFTYIINLTDQEVRATWSTTPEYEAAWFSDELKQCCCYTLIYLARHPATASTVKRPAVEIYLSGGGTFKSSRGSESSRGSGTF